MSYVPTGREVDGSAGSIYSKTRLRSARGTELVDVPVCDLYAAPDASQAHLIDPGVSRNNSANFPSSVDATSEIAQYATPSSMQRYTLYIHQSRSGRR
jgi:hypothetical protein